MSYPNIVFSTIKINCFKVLCSIYIELGLHASKPSENGSELNKRYKKRFNYTPIPTKTNIVGAENFP